MVLISKRFAPSVLLLLVAHGIFYILANCVQFEPDANETFRGADARTLGKRSRQDDAPPQLPSLDDSDIDPAVAAHRARVEAFLKPLEKLLSPQVRNDLRATLWSDDQYLSIMSLQVWTALEYMVVDDWAKNASTRLLQTPKADLQFFKHHLDCPSRFKSWPLAGYAPLRANWSAMQRRICTNTDLRAQFDEFNAMIRDKARRDIGLGANVGIPVNQTISDALLQCSAVDLANRIGELEEEARNNADVIAQLQEQVSSNTTQLRKKARAAAAASLQKKYQERLEKSRLKATDLAIQLRRSEESLRCFKEKVKVFSKRRSNTAFYSAGRLAASATARPTFNKPFDNVKDERTKKSVKSKLERATKMAHSRAGVELQAVVSRDKNGDVLCIHNSAIGDDTALRSLEARRDELAEQRKQGKRLFGAKAEQFALHQAALNVAVQAVRTARAEAKEEKIKEMKEFVDTHDPEIRMAILRAQEASAVAGAAAAADETSRFKSVPMQSFLEAAVAAVDEMAVEDDPAKRRALLDKFRKDSRKEELQAARRTAAEQEALKIKKTYQCRLALMTADRQRVPKRAYSTLSQLARGSLEAQNLWRCEGVGLPPEYDVQQYKSALNRELMEQCPLTPLVDGAECGWFIQPKDILNFLYHRFGLDIDNEHLVYRICMDGAGNVFMMHPSLPLFVCNI